MNIPEKETPQDYYPDVHCMALFLDIDNFAMSGRRGEEIATIINALKPWGNIVVRRAYANKLSPKRYLYSQLFKNHFEISEIDIDISHKKNSTDIRITVEVMEMLHTRPGINIYALASGDGDFIALVNRLHEYRRFVIGLGTRKTASLRLQQICDVFLSYEDMAFPVQPFKEPKIAQCSTQMKVGPEAMKTLLRKRNMYPPDPESRQKILSELYSLRDSAIPTFQALQQALCERCGQHGISKTAVRNCLNTLVHAGSVVEHSDQPLKDRKIASIPGVEEMTQAICKAQIGALLSNPNLLADPLAIARVVWGDPGRTLEVENELTSLTEATPK